MLSGAYGILCCFNFEYGRMSGVHVRVVHLKSSSNPSMKAHTRRETLEIRLIRGPLNVSLCRSAGT